MLGLMGLIYLYFLSVCMTQYIAVISRFLGGNVSTRIAQELAPAGHYAFNGVLYVCPAGYYGATVGLTTSTCSGPCAVPGYYCPGEFLHLFPAAK